MVQRVKAPADKPDTFSSKPGTHRLPSDRCMLLWQEHTRTHAPSRTCAHTRYRISKRKKSWVQSSREVNRYFILKTGI